MKFSESRLDNATSNGASRTQSSAVVGRIRTDIVAGLLAPGSKLRLPDLSRRYQTGVNPLREALARLSATGLVLLEDQKGFSVAPVSHEDLLDLTRVRTEIECLALRQAIDQGDVEWEARVIAAHHRLSRVKLTFSTNPRKLSDAWETVHLDFHLALISGCNSRWLIHFHNVLSEQSARYRRLSFSFANGKRDIAGEHARLVEAVLARDADRACELIRAHFSRTTELVLDGDAKIPAKAKR